MAWNKGYAVFPTQPSLEPLHSYPMPLSLWLGNLSLLLGYDTCSNRISLPAGLIRVVAFIFTVVTMWIFLRSYTNFNRKTIRLPRWLGEWGSWPSSAEQGLGC